MTHQLIDEPAPHDERIERLIAAFERRYGRRPEGIAEAPGRVNLIGEHVDYNDGMVLPFAINRSVMCAWRGETDLIGWESLEGEPGSGAVTNSHSFEPIEAMAASSRWFDYADGVVREFRLAGTTVDALDTLFSGDVPHGAGLSSSAAIEVATAGAFNAAFSLGTPVADLAVICQRAENEYGGVQCGIMDQFASALSRADHALLLDCRTLAYRHVPLRLADHGLAVVIANSALRRELVTSAYNQRRSECGRAVERLRSLLGRAELASLRDVSAAEIESLEIAPDDAELRRARHVVMEIGRVAACVDALDRDDFAAAGELMVESHRSLRDDYEVSSEQLDVLVGLATSQSYVLGARLTGAGFGGCTVNLVRAEAVEAFGRDVIAPYRERTGLPAVMYVTGAEDGLRTWRL